MEKEGIGWNRRFQRLVDKKSGGKGRLKVPSLSSFPQPKEHAGVCVCWGVGGASAILDLEGQVLHVKDP